eukprot:scaffold39727_cov58-Phaeocystis_antarctica.AAC.3
MSVVRDDPLSAPGGSILTRDHWGVVDVRGRRDFSRFDPRSGRPHFSNFVDNLSSGKRPGLATLVGCEGRWATFAGAAPAGARRPPPQEVECDPTECGPPQLLKAERPLGAVAGKVERGCVVRGLGLIQRRFRVNPS